MVTQARPSKRKEPMSSRILRYLHSLIQAYDAKPVVPVERHTCAGCRERFEGPGFLIGERRYCREICSPPFLRRNGSEPVHLVGDPGRG